MEAMAAVRCGLESSRLITGGVLEMRVNREAVRPTILKLFRLETDESSRVSEGISTPRTRVFSLRAIELSSRPTHRDNVAMNGAQLRQANDKKIHQKTVCE